MRIRLAAATLVSVSADERPAADVDYPSTYQEVLAWFPDDQSCVDYLAGLRWPEGFVCPACGAREFWRTRTGLWMCRSCERKTSVTAGTIFHRTRTPLTTWFAAIWFVTAQKNGVSATNLHQMLGFGSYETAWAWLHKLRRAMVRPDRDQLQGIVEVDETFVGGRTAGGARSGGRHTDKVPVAVAVERLPRNRLGRIRLAKLPSASKDNLIEFVTSNVAVGSTVTTDGSTCYLTLRKRGYSHKAINLSATDTLAHEELPGVHRVASLLKRWVAGTLHHGYSNIHLDYYLDEFTFRFNRRTANRRGLLFYRLLQQAMATDPHPLDALTSVKYDIDDFT